MGSGLLNDYLCQALKDEPPSGSCLSLRVWLCMYILTPRVAAEISNIFLKKFSLLFEAFIVIQCWIWIR